MLYTLIFVGGTAIAMFRLSPSSWNLFWAEDGSVFITDAYSRGLLENIFTPYAGYMHLVPRVTSQLVAVVIPANYAAGALALTASMVWSAVGLVAFDFSRGFVSGAGLRLVLWAMVLVFPFGSLEVVANVANSHWFLIFGLFWALVARERGTLQIISAALIAICAIMSDPLALVAAPLALSRTVLLRTLKANIVTIAYGVAAVMQLVVVMGTRRDTGQVHPSVGDVVDHYLLRVVWGGIVGQTTGVDTYLSWGAGAVLLLASGIFLTVLVGAVYVARRTLLPLVALGFSIGFSVVTTWLTWEQVGDLLPANLLTGGSRYPVVPMLTFYSAVVVLVGALVEGVAPRRARMAAVVAGLALAVLVVSWLPNYRTDSRAVIPSVGGQMDGSSCPNGESVVIDILPGPPWTARIPCRAIR